MNTRAWVVRSLSIVIGVYFGATPHALIFYATDDPAHNTTEPQGVLAGSGWQLEGQWHGMTGTPIASNLFLTAKHINGNVGESLSFQGQLYPTLEAYADAESDLVIWRVCGTFPATATLCSDANEVNKPVVLFGRGLTRGSPVVVTNSGAEILKGWQWGGGDGKLRWGQNLIAGVARGAQGQGEFLVTTFDADGSSEETALAGGDSGGGWFVQTEIGWQLAAISYAVDGPFDFTGSGPGFSASLFDTAGLYEWDGTAFVFTPDTGAPQPVAMYGTRVSARMTWINSILSAHAGGEAPPALQTALTPDGPYANATAAVVHADAKTISLPLPESNIFVRLSHCRSLRILGIARRDGRLELRYE